MKHGDIEVSKNIDISYLQSTIIDFIRTNMVNIKPYEEKQELYMLNVSPLVIEASVRRLQDIIYVNINCKSINYNASNSTDYFNNEMVWICTYLLVRFIKEADKFKKFIDKVDYKLTEYLDIINRKSNVVSFDVIDPNTVKLFDIFNNQDRRSLRKISVVNSFKNIVVDTKFLSDILFDISSQIQDQVDFEQYRIYFKGLEIADGLTYTNFTILINAIQYDNKKECVYFIIDIVNDDNDRKTCGLDNGEFYSYGVVSASMKPGREVSSIYRLDWRTINDFEPFLDEVAKKIYNAMKVISSSCKVKEIIVERKEI